MAFMALRSLQMHKLRSALTVLGLVFGVASVIVMLSLPLPNRAQPVIGAFS